MKEDLIKAVKAALLPELAELKSALTLTNQRLDDFNTRLSSIDSHLVDQSRRIDSIMEYANSVRDGLEERFEALRTAVESRLQNVHERLDRLYEIVVRREEHEKLSARIDRLEQEMTELKKRFAA
jgi:polyhydroxyalkanoate synthesis regulator phasin